MATSLHSKGEKPDKCKISYFSKTNNFPNFPQHELDTLARCLYPAILAYFESEEGKREFAQWEAQQEQNSEQRQYLSDTAPLFLYAISSRYTINPNPSPIGKRFGLS